MRRARVSTSAVVPTLVLVGLWLACSGCVARYSA
jgi:hypothetical protein